MKSECTKFVCFCAWCQGKEEKENKHKLVSHFPTNLQHQDHISRTQTKEPSHIALLRSVSNKCLFLLCAFPKGIKWTQNKELSLSVVLFQFPYQLGRMLGAAYSRNEYNTVERRKFTALSGHQTPLSGYSSCNWGLYALKHPHSRNGMLGLTSSALQIFISVICKFKCFDRYNQAKYYDFFP